MSRPLVSIITPTYNSSGYICETIASVQQQTEADWEHIAVDDCSQDHTRDLLLEHEQKDSRLKTVFLKSNQGPAAARNTGIQVASGRYIAFVDSDDLWEPDKLSLQLACMRRPECSFVFGSYYKMMENGPGRALINVPERIDYHGLLNSTVIATLTAMYDSLKLGKVFMPDIRKRQDFGLWLRLLKKTPWAYGIQQPLGTLRKRRGSLSSNKPSAMYYTWRVYRECEKLSLCKSIYCFCNYALRAFIKARR